MDAKTVAALRKSDKRLARLMDQVHEHHGPIRIEIDPMRQPYQALVRAVVYQQLHGKAAATILERLTAIRGVGQWTVEMLLIFKLGRPDILPVTDYGVRKGFALTYGWKELPTPRELMEFGERWRPYRTTVSWYFWRAVDLLKVKSAAAGAPRAKARAR